MRSTILSSLVAQRPAGLGVLSLALLWVGCSTGTDPDAGQPLPVSVQLLERTTLFPVGWDPEPLVYIAMPGRLIVLGWRVDSQTGYAYGGSATLETGSLLVQQDVRPPEVGLDVLLRTRYRLDVWKIPPGEYRLRYTLTQGGVPLPPGLQFPDTIVTIP